MAVALVSKKSFAERVAAFGRPRDCAVLVWSFHDLLHPEVVLESPHEVRSLFNSGLYTEHNASKFCSSCCVLHTTCLALNPQQARLRADCVQVTAFDFNRADPNTVVGGCANGRVILWEITAAAGESAGAEGAGGIGTEEHRDIVVQHKCVSMAEASHRLPVSQLEWLPGWDVRPIIPGVSAPGAVCQLRGPSGLALPLRNMQLLHLCAAR